MAVALLLLAWGYWYYTDPSTGKEQPPPVLAISCMATIAAAYSFSCLLRSTQNVTKPFNIGLPLFLGVLYHVSIDRSRYGPLNWLITAELFTVGVRGRALGERNTIYSNPELNDRSHAVCSWTHDQFTSGLTVPRSFIVRLSDRLICLSYVQAWLLYSTGRFRCLSTVCFRG